MSLFKRKKDDEDGPEKRYQDKLKDAPQNAKSVRRQRRWLPGIAGKRVHEHDPDRRSRYNEKKGRDDGKG